LKNSNNPVFNRERTQKSAKYQIGKKTDDSFNKKYLLEILRSFGSSGFLVAEGRGGGREAR
jgi:hypothetical protein